MFTAESIKLLSKCSIINGFGKVCAVAVGGSAAKTAKRKIANTTLPAENCGTPFNKGDTTPALADSGTPRLRQSFGGQAFVKGETKDVLFVFVRCIGIMSILVP